MAKQRPAWVKDVLVFVWFAALNLVLFVPGGYAIYLFTPATVGAEPFVVWQWVFGFPACVAREFECWVLMEVLFWVNPLIYGAMGWFAWKMFRLMRAKPPEGDSPPLHNE